MSNPWAFGWDQLFGAVNTIAVVSGIAIAIWGIVKWRAEQIGKRQCELGEEALALCYEAQDVFDYVRNPAGFEGEGATRQRSAHESEETRQKLDSQFVPIERLNEQSDFFLRAQRLRPRFKALFGMDATAPIDELFKVRRDIVVAARILSHYAADAAPTDASIADKRQKFEKTKWKISDDDEVQARLDNACRQVEKIVGPILKSRYRK